MLLALIYKNNMFTEKIHVLQKGNSSAENLDFINLTLLITLWRLSSKQKFKKKNPAII